METHTTQEQTSDTTTLFWTAAIAVLWLVVAFVRPGTTLHLGPLLVPIVPAIVARGTDHAVRSTVVGIALAAAVLVVLAASGHLDGPALGPFPDALAESLVFLGIGSIAGLGYAKIAK
jgi:hypothetical protein